MKKTFTTIVAAAAFAIILLSGCASEAALVNEPYDIPRVSYDANADLTIKVATYNLWGGKMTREKIAVNAAFFNRSNYDVVGLQEIDRNTARSGNVDYLAELKTGVFGEALFASTRVPGFGDSYGLGAISQHATEDFHIFRLPYPYDKVDAAIEQRVAIRFVVRKSDVPVAIYVTHLSYENADCRGTPLRAAQIDFLKNVIQSDPAPYKLLMGDFNVEDLVELDPLRSIGMTPVLNDASLGYTYVGDDGSLVIDNILYSSTLRPAPESVKLIDDLQTSDHNLLEATFVKAA